MNYWDELMGDDDHAASYMATYGEGPGAITRETLGHFIEAGETVIDVGCGPGWNMDHFAQFGPDIEAYKGVDYSERFVRVANQRLEGENTQDHTNIKIHPFELQDCRDLKEEDGSWDVVVIQDCLEHTNGYEKPMEEALRVAKKRVIAVFWHMDENNEHINDDGNDGYGATYARPKWEKYLDSLGHAWFHHQIMDTKPKPRDYYIIDKEEPK